GGGIAADGYYFGSSYFPGSATITDCTISGNSAPFSSGIHNGGTLTVSNCTVSGNSGSADPTGSRDGGISNYWTLTVNNSTISGNSGSGIYNPGFANRLNRVTVNNSTISGNSGSGIYNVGS